MVMVADVADPSTSYRTPRGPLGTDEDVEADDGGDAVPGADDPKANLAMPKTATNTTITPRKPSLIFLFCSHFLTVASTSHAGRPRAVSEARRRLSRVPASLL